MTMHAITLMPSEMTVPRQVLASHHATRGTVKVFSLLTIFRRIALAIFRLLNRSYLPQCPEEQRLRHPRTELLLQEISSLFRRTALAVSRLLNRRQILQCPEEQRLRHPRTELLLQEISSEFFFRIPN